MTNSPKIHKRVYQVSRTTSFSPSAYDQNTNPCLRPVSRVARAESAAISGPLITRILLRVNDVVERERNATLPRHEARKKPLPLPLSKERSNQKPATSPSHHTRPGPALLPLISISMRNHDSQKQLVLAHPSLLQTGSLAIHRPEITAPIACQRLLPPNTIVPVPRHNIPSLALASAPTPLERLPGTHQGLQCQPKKPQVLSCVASHTLPKIP